MKRFTLKLCIILLSTAGAEEARAQRKTSPNAKPVIKVLVRTAETARVAMDGASLLDALETLTQQATPEVKKLILLVSTSDLSVEEERSYLRKEKEAQGHTWKSNPKNFEYLVSFERDLVEATKSFIAEPLRITVKETWTIEKISDPTVRKSWTASYFLTAEGPFGPQQAERSATREILVVIAKRATILDETRSFINSPTSVIDGAISYFIKMLKHGDFEVREYAAMLLGSLVPYSKKAVPNLVEALSDSWEGTRQSAALSLGKLGADAKASVAALKERLKDSKSLVRVRSAQALIRLGDTEAALPVLIESLTDSSYAGELAAEVIGDIGPAAEPAVPALINLLKVGPFSANRAAEALGKIGPAAKAAVPALVVALQSRDNGALRFYAAEALVTIDPKAAIAALPELIDNAKKKQNHFRERAIKALGKIGSEANSAIPVLTEALKDSDEKIRTAAAEALRNIQKR